MSAVSVIVPAYNCEKYIVECVESVFNQTFTDFELIVVDDGSTDETRKVLLPYLGRLTYVRQPNGGCASARNHGIRLAKGKYIAFLDNDDVWLPHKLERQLDCFNRHPDAGLVYAPHLRVEEDGSERPSRRDPNSLPEGRIFRQLFQRDRILTSSVIVRREVIEKVGTFDESLPPVDDTDMWMRIAHEYECRPVREVLWKKRIRADQFSQDRDTLDEYTMRVIRKIYDLYKDSPPRVTGEMYRAKMIDQHVKMARGLLRRGDRKGSRAMAVAALRLQPVNPAAMAAYIRSFVG